MTDNVTGGGTGVADYHFWQDFFDTYQSLPDWLKLVWLILPVLTFLGLIALLLRYRLARHRINANASSDRGYSLYLERTEHLPIEHQPTLPIEDPQKLTDEQP